MSAIPKAAPDSIFLFCYGSLKRGEPGHELMTTATFVSTVMKTNLRWIREAEYPTCIETSDATDFVVGEIWNVPVADLPLLNSYEGTNYKLVKLVNSNLHAYLPKNDADKYVETT